MDKIEFYSLHQRQIHATEDDQYPRTSAKLSISSDSSTSSVSSLILSMCPVSIVSNNYFLTNDSPLNENRHSFLDPSLCKVCKTCYSSNQYNTCHQCYQEQVTIKSDSSQHISTNQNSDHQIETLKLLTKDEKSHNNNTRQEIPVINYDKSKKKSNYNFTRLLRFNRHRQSLTDLLENSSNIPTESCLYQLRPKNSIATINLSTSQPLIQSETTIKTIKIPPPPPSNPFPHSICLSTERMNYYKQRQIELDRTIEKLIESLTIKTNENIQKISKHWSYLKQTCLDNIQPKLNRYQFFYYILKPYTNRQIEEYIEENDEIKATLQVLLTTITIVNNKYSYSTINQLFNYEEKTMIEYLYNKLEFLLSSYSDELSFIHESIHFYQSCLNEDKNLNWIQIIKNDYPLLIEKISNDFIINIPQLDQILIKMLRNMKKRLLNINIELIN